MSIYSSLKMFHFQDKVDSLSPDNTEIKPPIHIRLKPTNVCNHDCIYCAYRVSNLQLGKNMNIPDTIPKDKMIELINDFDEMGVKAVTFSGGGEPFAYKHLAMAGEMLAERNIAFASLSNGNLLRGHAADIFSQYATWLRISIDGWDGPSYAQYRRVKESAFETVIQNIENFQKKDGKCILGVSFIIDKDNADKVYEMAMMMKDIGANSIKLSPCIIANTQEENNRYHQPFYQKTKDLCQKAVEELGDDNFEVYDSYHLMNSKFEKEYDWCPFIQIKPVIGADLNIYSCQDKAYNLDSGLVGSIKEMSFKEFWHQNKEQFFKINPSKECNHHCVMNNHNKMILEYINSKNDHLSFV